MVDIVVSVYIEWVEHWEGLNIFNINNNYYNNIIKDRKPLKM